MFAPAYQKYHVLTLMYLQQHVGLVQEIFSLQSDIDKEMIIVQLFEFGTERHAILDMLMLTLTSRHLPVHTEVCRFVSYLAIGYDNLTGSFMCCEYSTRLLQIPMRCFWVCKDYAGKTRNHFNKVGCCT